LRDEGGGVGRVGDAIKKKWGFDWRDEEEDRSVEIGIEEKKNIIKICREPK
jgi:hypothetical protein